MDLRDAKTLGAFLLGGANVGLLVWAVRQHFERDTMPAAYFRAVSVAQGIAILQVLAGLALLAQGLRAPAMHLVYGGLLAAGAGAQQALKPGTALGQAYMGKPLVHAVLALFLALVALRGYLSA